MKKTIAALLLPVISLFCRTAGYGNGNIHVILPGQLWQPGLHTPIPAPKQSRIDEYPFSRWQDTVRGTWITNVGSEVLRSKENIEAAAERCRSAGINTIFMVVWNKGLTMHPSRVLNRYIGLSQDPAYAGRDPLQEMLDAAHRRGIKVHAWFEFGFSFAYGDSSGTWIRKYPHWVGKMAGGGLLKKNGFYWWNALHPEVQQFMSELVLEVVRKYGVDGVQGDDRLPAMPSEGGYDEYTSQLYAQTSGGKSPPSDHLDSAWVQWRCDRLNDYIRSLYAAVKKERADCLVTWAPSIYPWSREQYLQDWPAWLAGGYADLVIPQLYRYDLAAYEKILLELKQQVPVHLRHKVYPGILTSLGGGYEVKPALLKEMIRLNRLHGFHGEVSFYFETLRRSGPYY